MSLLFVPLLLKKAIFSATPKHNYAEKIDRPVFTGRNRKEEVRTKGEPRAVFLVDEGLSVFSHPIDWMDAFIPVYLKACKSSRTPHHLSIAKLCRWSNKKTALLEMGTNSLYKTFVPFSTADFEQYMYIRYFNGLNPSPRVEDKFQTEATGPVQSNPFL